MEKGNITLLKTNLVNRDSRLEKELLTVLGDDYAVTLLCWNREQEEYDFKPDVGRDSYEEIQLSLRAPYGPLILFFLPIWWCFAALRLLRSHHDIVHAINLDSVVPAVILAKITNKPVIYEMFDVYAHQNVPLPSAIRWIGVQIEKLFVRSADAVVIVDEARVEEFGGVVNRNTVVINNSPPDLLEKFKERGVENRDSFNLFFASILSRGRSLERVVEAVRSLEDVELTIAGFSGDLVEEIEKWAAENPEQIHFIGRVGTYREILERSFQADLLFCLYEPEIPNIVFTSPNKLFEAMMCGKPILVSEGTAMANIVRGLDCGLVVDCHSVREIRKAIRTLKEDSHLCERLGRNGRRAYEAKYSWSLMQERLLNTYGGLLNKGKLD